MAIPRIEAYSLNGIADGVVNKVNWTLGANKSVLLVHDMQQYFVDFYDQTQEPVISLIKNIKQIIQTCRDLGIPIVYTAQPGDQTVKDRALLTDFWGDGLKDDETLTKILPALAPQVGDTVLTKWRYSAFQRSNLKQHLTDWNRQQLIIVGVYAHIGCMQTAMEAFMSDIQAFLVSNAVADFSQGEQKMALDYVAGRGGMVMDTEQIISALSTEMAVA